MQEKWRALLLCDLPLWNMLFSSKARQGRDHETRSWVWNDYEKCRRPRRKSGTSQGAKILARPNKI